MEQSPSGGELEHTAEVQQRGKSSSEEEKRVRIPGTGVHQSIGNDHIYT